MTAVLAMIGCRTESANGVIVPRMLMAVTTATSAR
jgi:hypothetical protein